MVASVVRLLLRSQLERKAAFGQKSSRSNETYCPSEMSVACHCLYIGEYLLSRKLRWHIREPRHNTECQDISRLCTAGAFECSRFKLCHRCLGMALNSGAIMGLPSGCEFLELPQVTQRLGDVITRPHDVGYYDKKRRLYIPCYFRWRLSSQVR